MEDAGSVTVTVTRINGSAGAASVNYATAAGTALAGTDYTAASGTLTWMEWDSADQSIVVPILNRPDAQGSRSFSIMLSGATGAMLGSPAAATVTITDSGAAPAAPTGLSASDGTYTNKVRLTWNATPQATGYQVWRHTAADSAAASLLGTSGEQVYDDSTAVPETLYYYWLKATNADGVSDFSAGDSGYALPLGPAITANGASGAITVAYPEPVTIAVAMNADIYAGVEVDWWVVAFAHSGEWYYLNNAMQWALFSGDLAFCLPVYRGALFNLSATTVLDRYQLPRGTYDFWFAVDYPMDGILDVNGQILFEKVTVGVQ
jgi:hypothetical protein